MKHLNPKKTLGLLAAAVAVSALGQSPSRHARLQATANRPPPPP